ncbi:hypothetical protein COLO4_34645 [Corchorus olitorius]|uniref:Uncharacterized protein n=1 Tax=Corchorus olitorius TaxID=93759 RepID=A0A1R3GK14_9ROSI|nr:hypothetical protein COLO4_34645 [Corchorus olitorius]
MAKVHCGLKKKRFGRFQCSFLQLGGFRVAMEIDRRNNHRLLSEEKGIIVGFPTRVKTSVHVGETAP